LNKWSQDWMFSDLQLQQKWDEMKIAVVRFHATQNTVLISEYTLNKLMVPRFFVYFAGKVWLMRVPTARPNKPDTWLLSKCTKKVWSGAWGKSEKIWWLGSKQRLMNGEFQFEYCKKMRNYHQQQIGQEVE